MHYGDAEGVAEVQKTAKEGRAAGMPQRGQVRTLQIEQLGQERAFRNAVQNGL